MENQSKGEAKKQGHRFWNSKVKKLLLDFGNTIVSSSGVENVVLNVTISSSHFHKWLYNVFLNCPCYELTKCALGMALLETSSPSHGLCVCVTSLQSWTIHDSKTQNPRTELQLKHIILFFCFSKTCLLHTLTKLIFPIFRAI